RQHVSDHLERRGAGLQGADVVDVERGGAIAIVGLEIQVARREGVARAKAHAQKDVYAGAAPDDESRRTLQCPLAIDRIDGLLKEKPLARRDSALREEIPVWTEERSQHVVNEIFCLLLG